VKICNNTGQIITELQKPMHICTKHPNSVQICKKQCRLAEKCNNLVKVDADLQTPMHICSKQQGSVQIGEKTVQKSADLLLNSASYSRYAETNAYLHNTAQISADLQENSADCCRSVLIWPVSLQICTNPCCFVQICIGFCRSVLICMVLLQIHADLPCVVADLH
jgi:hypothetical protein